MSCSGSTVIDTRRKFAACRELTLELRELEALARTRLRALGVDEVEHPDETAQVVARDRRPDRSVSENDGTSP